MIGETSLLTITPHPSAQEFRIEVRYAYTKLILNNYSDSSIKNRSFYFLFFKTTTTIIKTIKLIASSTGYQFYSENMVSKKCSAGCT